MFFRAAPATVFLLVCTAVPLSAAPRLTPLATPPDWTRLDPFQKTITRNEFVRLLQAHAPNGAAYPWILIDGSHALIRKESGSPAFYKLRFAPSAETARKPPVFWRPLPEGKLTGTRIAIDPGHLGGEWARLEERWFQIGTAPPVTEGDMTLLVAQKVALRLRAQGAQVSLIRNSSRPLTSLRPEKLSTAAQSHLRQLAKADGAAPASGVADPESEAAVTREANRLFYRQGEIRARARRNNQDIRPDLTICLHFNAEPWGNPQQPSLVNRNHLHLLIHGNASSEEISFDDMRLELLLKLLARTLDTEVALADRVALSMAASTGLPAYRYSTPNARAVGKSGFVWLRNLAASRLYTNPVLYLEPYVMNHQEVYDRIQMGDYSGTRPVGGKERPSIYEEYADAVLKGLLQAVSP